MTEQLLQRDNVVNQHGWPLSFYRRFERDPNASRNIVMEAVRSWAAASAPSTDELPVADTDPPSEG